MEYRRLGGSGIKVSPLCLGTMMFGGATAEEESIRIMHRAIDEGINFFDAANIYAAGRSEEVIGKALAGDKRDQVILATKGRSAVGTGPNQAGASRKHLMEQLEGSLRRLRTEVIDLYYVHAPDWETPLDETLRALDDMVRSGKVHYIGCSNFRAWMLCRALWTSDKLNLNRFVCLQPLYNMVNRDIEVEVLPLCRDQQIGVVSYSPLARGILSGKYRQGEAFPEGSRAARQDKRMQQAELRDESLELSEELNKYCAKKGVKTSQFALAWCLANKLITSVILGPRTMEQFEDNLGCLKVQVTAEDEAFVDTLIPPGEHTGKGFQDTAYPITGRVFSPR
ncbi:MAG: aldo/keto reductase [Planctomycetales bacterium]